jgi:catechol 2,3-dioxygenase-like lactoylglutathione lyase family enzyme
MDFDANDSGSPMNVAPKTCGLLETAIHGADLKRTADFYRRVLGLATLLETPRLVALDAGGASVLLVFQAGATEADLADERGVIPGHGGSGRIHFALAIPEDSLQAWRERLAAHGVALTGEYRWPRGGTSLYFDDPDCHVVELATPGLWANY